MSTPEPTRPRLLQATPWAVVLAGVLVMIVLFALATGYLTGGPRHSSGAPDPAWPFAPGATPSSVASVDDAPSPARSSAGGFHQPTSAADRQGGGDKEEGSRATPTRTTASPPRPTTAAPKPPPEPPLTGRYRVLADYRDSFIAEVFIRNDGDSAQSWRVELRFRSEVHGLRAFWVEGAPRPSVDRDGSRYVFRSGAPLQGNRSDPLRFHLDRWGNGERPISCTVNGRPCEIR
ncbi:hypothetical protein ACN28C_16145 [Plantactinospora sp. WMMC1484]|uniref:hypothetical protein n=1 Tax=Plantactinospora sp. WMMC1484 TaxID=3404122 RepID=UPI003BF58EF8